MNKIIILCTLLLFLVSANAQNKEIDSLKHLLSTEQQDTNKVKDLVNLGWAYQWNKPDSALSYGLQARKLSQQLNYIDGELKSAALLSEALNTKGNFAQALEIAQKALQLAKNNGKQRLFLNARLGFNTMIGNIYSYSGDYQKALDHYLKDRNIESYSDKIFMGFIGEMYYHLARFDSALFYINKSYQLDQKDSSGHWSVPYYFMGLMETREGKYREALANYKTGLFYATGQSMAIAEGNIWIAGMFKQMGKVDSSIYYAKEALGWAQKESLTPKVMDASSLLCELYIDRNTDSAFKYQRIMLAAKDSSFSEEKIKQLQNLAFNEQMRQQELQQTELKYRNRLNMYIFLAGFVVLSIVVFGLWRRNRYKQKSYALLEKQNLEIDRQKTRVEQTLQELKNTQSQLIQTEKMASLGELTAGIAHEIQNPLNFVNNFSDVNRELLAEMKDEIKKGNTDEVNAIADNVIDNEEKINHHGKQADAIVKGMLQHSQSSAGKKEPADLNALADEYLRLSYHGLRARDKSFKASMQTDYDSTIGHMNIIPQDIGRVLLNLYNNAFYAVSERRNNSVMVMSPRFLSVRRN